MSFYPSWDLGKMLATALQNFVSLLFALRLAIGTTARTPFSLLDFIGVKDGATHPARNWP